MQKATKKYIGNNRKIASLYKVYAYTYNYKSRQHTKLMINVMAFLLT